GYGLVMWQWFGQANGGFGSLADVERLFESRGVLLAGWMHFLAFDLWLGRWQVDYLREVTRADAASRWAWWMRAGLLLCLGMTFLFGPLGLLLFLLLIGIYRLARRPSPAAA
ncbi:MAG: abscisic acid-deficient protein Aba4 family protein, partial [Curvibacter sp.]